MKLDYKNSKQKSTYSELPRGLVLQIHQFVITTKNTFRLGQRSLAERVKEVFGVNISENTISGWIHRSTVPFANEKTQFKSKPVPQKESLKELYLEKQISASKIAKKFNVSTIIVINWLRDYGIKTRAHRASMNTGLIKKELSSLRLKQPQISANITPEKTYVLGVLCGDAYLSGRMVRLEIRNDEDFISRFAQCLEKVYSLKANYRYYAKRNTLILEYHSMLVAKNLRSYGSFRTKTWAVPVCVMNSYDKELVGSFLRGLFDSDGSVGHYQVSLTSASLKGIEDVHTLLTRLDIKSKVRTDKRGYHSIYITGKTNIWKFKNLIGFTIKRKMERFSTMYRGYKRD